MSTYRLKNLLSPRSVALVGASPRQGSVGRAILGNIRKAEFKGEFGLVNPRYAEIDGVAAVDSLDKLPFVPELVVVTAPAKSIPGLIDEAGRCGAAGAVIVSAGLGHGPGSLADAAERAAQKYGMRLIGPNCLGIMMPCVNLNASFSAHMPGQGKSGADLAVGRHCRRHGGLGGAARGRLFRDRVDRRSARRRYRRPARLFRAGREDAGDPALYRSDQGCPQIHVGGARRRPDQAGRRRQVRPHGARRQGRRHPYRRAGRIGRGLRRRVPARRHPAGVGSARIVRLRRDARAAQIAAGQAARDPDQWRRHRRARGRPAGRAGRNSRRDFARDQARSSMRYCRRPGRDRTRSISSATPTPRAMRRRSRCCWPIPATMPSW